MRNTNASKDSAANSSFLVLHSSLILVFKVTEPCYHHCNVMFVAIIKREFILDASARLNYSLNAFITCNFHAIREGEESIARHYGAVQVEAEVLGLLNGLFQGVHTAGLTYTACQQLLAFSQYNSVGLAVLHYLVRFFPKVETWIQ